jgi:hypothetical protein
VEDQFSNGTDIKHAVLRITIKASISSAPLAGPLNIRSIAWKAAVPE